MEPKEGLCNGNGGRVVDSTDLLHVELRTSLLLLSLDSTSSEHGEFFIKNLVPNFLTLI